MGHHYTSPSRLTRAGYRFAYDPLRAAHLKDLVASLQLTGDERVLDFGSGPGSEAIHFARALDRGGRVTCLDVSPTWLAEAQRRLRGFENAHFLLGEATEVGLVSEFFDLIVAHYVLHDVDPEALPATLAALAESLRPGGRFLVVEPIGGRHGLSAAELVALMKTAGLTEASQELLRSRFGSALKMVFTRPAPGQPVRA
jgi:ubiquinone/menaquinone biosynthesis C-methylase UbiE